MGRAHMESVQRKTQARYNREMDAFRKTPESKDARKYSRKSYYVAKAAYGHHGHMTAQVPSWYEREYQKALSKRFVAEEKKKTQQFIKVQEKKRAVAEEKQQVFEQEQRDLFDVYYRKRHSRYRPFRAGSIL